MASYSTKQNVQNRGFLAYTNQLMAPTIAGIFAFGLEFVSAKYPVFDVIPHRLGVSA